MKYLPIKTDLLSFVKELNNYTHIKYTQSFAERISESGDIAGSPFAHWRWKKNCIADIIIWPKEEEDIILILKLANKYRVPITPRGAGTGYFGSGVSAYGGIILDLKHMKNFTVDLEKNLIIAQPGTCFNTIIEALDEKEYQLGCYPTSALSSTLGGWIGTGGNAGVGTFKYGPFIDQIEQLKLISPIGELRILNRKKDFEQYFGTSGIFGIISEIKLKIFPKEKKLPLFFGFNDLNALFEILTKLIEYKNIYHMVFSDVEYEIRSTTNSEYKYYLFIVLSDIEQGNSTKKKEIIEFLEQNSGSYLGEDLSIEKWQDYLKTEMKIKQNTSVLMLQSLYLDLDSCQEMIKLFENVSKARKLNHCYSGLINKNQKIRLTLFTPTDSDKIIHFLASKAVLHRVVKELYKMEKGNIYTYGMLNATYLHKYEPDKLKQWIDMKKTCDPNYILNPYKIIMTRISFRRINIIFEMNLFWRSMAVRINTAQQVLDIEKKTIKMGR